MTSAGYPAATNPKAHEKLVMRLVRKVESARREMADYRVTNPDAEQVFVSYGAPTRTVHQVLHDRPKEEIGHLQLRVVWPFPEFALSEFPDAKSFLVPEMNLGQMAREMERHTDVPVIPVPKIGGYLHTPVELVRPWRAPDEFQGLVPGRPAPHHLLRRVRERDGHQLHARTPSIPWAGSGRRRSLSRGSGALRVPRATYGPTPSIPPTGGRSHSPRGSRLARPDLHVVVFTGDGDLAAIGGNHFIHACRRNVDMTVICMNNWIYGMTGGQGSPTTPRGAITTTTPYGSGEGVFDLSALAVAAGANHVARWTSYHVKELTRAIQTGLETPGFSLIEVLTQCPTAYGRRNKFRDVAETVEYPEDPCHPPPEVQPARSREGKPVPEDMFTVGEFVSRNRPVMGVPP